MTNRLGDYDQDTLDGLHAHSVQLQAERDRFRAALSEILTHAAQRMAERGINGFDQGDDTLVYLKDTAEDALMGTK